MSQLLEIKALRRRLTSVLGLTLEDGRLEGLVLRRSNGSAQPQQPLSVSLTLDPLSADPELVGRELRNHLDAAEIRERHCVVGLPLKWVLTTQVEVPKLPAADLAGFLQIEAERGFPSDISTLFLARSLCQLRDGKQHATIVGVSRAHLERLEQVLRAARLKPVSFSLGSAALQPPGAETAAGVVAISIGDSQVALQINAGGGVAALRNIEGALETEGGRRALNAGAVVREVRITLGQLPAEIRELLRSIRIFGPRDLAQQLADELELRLEASGLKIEVVSRYATGELGVQLPAETPVAPALSLAAGRLANRAPAFELLPPRVPPWRVMMNRYSSGKLAFAGGTAGAVALLVAALFLYQQWRLADLRSQWLAIAASVTDAQKIQDRIHQFRPWYDETDRGLTILKRLTAAFPEDGVVTAKTVELRDTGENRGLNTVMCSGQTRDNQALVELLDRLRAADGVSEVKLGTLRGKSPLQFTFEFRWSQGGKSEN